MNGNVWEPWEPKVGQHVRVKIGPECPLRDHWNGGDDPHADEVGTVCMTSDGLGYPPNGHDYLVMADERADGSYRTGGWYAAIELEPVP